MLGFIIMMLVISSLMGDQRGQENARKILRGLITMIAVIYGIRIILYTGFTLIPLIIIGWAVMNIFVPFIRGFISSFERK